MKRKSFFAWLLILLSATAVFASERVVCAACGKAISGKYFRTLTGYAFCSRECLAGPKCFVCSNPKNLTATPDGRLICSECSKTVVKTRVELESLFRELRRELAEIYGFDEKHPIRFEVVPPAELEKLAGGSRTGSGSGIRMALMKYHYTLETTTAPDGKVTKKFRDECRVYALDRVPRDRLSDALVHELAHDYLRHYAGRDIPVRDEEGFCEAVAGDWNTRHNRGYLNLSKMENPDKVYGDGYRDMKLKLEKYGFRKLAETLRREAKPYDESGSGGAR